MDAILCHLTSGDSSEDQAVYQQFAEAAQEPLRLRAALKGFFLKPAPPQAHLDAYGAYLKRRIRPAAEALIEQEDTDKLTQLAALGWINKRLMDEFLQTAQMRRKPAALVCLLRLKQEYYGFQDRDFSL